MADQEKTNGMAVISDDFLESTNSYLSGEMKGTVDDQRDMYRLGKHQQLRVWRSLTYMSCTDLDSATFASSLYLASQ
jgi:hypothetical protein